MSHCSSCGRYVGPYEACPYCGARQTGRIKVRTVKVGAVLLASVGFAVLWLAATKAPIPQVQIGQAAATMNMAYVRVEGWVVDGPTYYPDSGYLAFTIADETGEIRLSAYGKETAALRSRGHIPSLGDWVSAAGTLRVREYGPALTINVPRHVEVLRPEAQGRELISLSPDDRLLRVRVRGQVWQVRQPYEGLTIITLRDTSGKVDVVIDHILETLSGQLLPLAAGQSVEVIGTVDLYQDTPQIVPASMLDIVLLPEPVSVAETLEIGLLDVRHVGHLVAISGTTTEVIHLPIGTKLTLADSTGEVAVLIWEDTLQEMETPLVLEVGTALQILGEVSLYNDELEVIPQRPIDIVLSH